MEACGVTAATTQQPVRPHANCHPGAHRPTPSPPTQPTPASQSSPYCIWPHGRTVARSCCARRRAGIMDTRLCRFRGRGWRPVNPPPPPNYIPHHHPPPVPLRRPHPLRCACVVPARPGQRRQSRGPLICAKEWVTKGFQRVQHARVPPRSSTCSPGTGQPHCAHCYDHMPQWWGWRGRETTAYHHAGALPGAAPQARLSEKPDKNQQLDKTRPGPALHDGVPVSGRPFRPAEPTMSTPYLRSFRAGRGGVPGEITENVGKRVKPPGITRGRC